MDRINYNYSTQNYNNYRNVNGNSSNNVHRSLPSQYSTARYRFNYNKYGPRGVNGPQNQSGSYAPNQSNSATRYGNGFGNTFVAPSPTNSKIDDSLNEEDFSEKLIAYARFNRNTDLVKTILSEVMVPDVRQVVTTGRLKILQDQVRTLEDHYKKVDVEVNKMETDYTNKKRKFNESTTEYHRDYKKLCRPAVGLQMYHGMVTKYYNYMKQHAEKQRWEKTLAWAHQTAAETSPTVVANYNGSTFTEILENDESKTNNFSYCVMFPKDGERKTPD